MRVIVSISSCQHLLFSQCRDTSLGATQTVFEQEDSESLPECGSDLLSEAGVMADDNAVASTAAPSETSAAPLAALDAAQQGDTSSKYAAINLCLIGLMMISSMTNTSCVLLLICVFCVHSLGCTHCRYCSAYGLL